MLGSRARAAFPLSVLLCLVVGLFVTACQPSGGSSSTSGSGSTVDAAKKAIQNTGSDTMLNVAQAWSEAYLKVKPGISVEISGGGSGVGIKDLIQGTVHIANCSRMIKSSERTQAIQNTGKEPQEFIVGYDGIGIYVHRDNPLTEITLGQLADIYKESGTTAKWSQLGVDSAKFCASDDIVRFSRQSNSGTYQYFRAAVLAKGDFKLGSNDLHGSKDVVEAVGTTACGIGYSGMGYKTDHVSFLGVAQAAGEIPYQPTTENVLNGNYAIARPLLMYTLGEPTGEIKEYLDWIFSPAGQKILEENGYVPLKSK